MMAWIDPANKPNVNSKEGFPNEKEERDEWPQIESYSELLSLSSSNSFDSLDTCNMLNNSSQNEEEQKK